MSARALRHQVGCRVKNEQYYPRAATGIHSFSCEQPVRRGTLSHGSGFSLGLLVLKGEWVSEYKYHYRGIFIHVYIWVWMIIGIHSPTLTLPSAAVTVSRTLYYPYPDISTPEEDSNKTEGIQSPEPSTMYSPLLSR